ncbi:uncharacterized protein METZ01_LOCUS445105, partial [marine metagenome]
EIVLAAVRNDGEALKYANDGIKADREIVLAAVQKNGDALQYASDGLKADREIVLAAVQNDGNALKYASDELRADREIGIAAVKQNRFASRFSLHREIVLAGIQRGSWELQYVSEEFRADREIVMTAVQNDGRSIKYASEELRADPEIIQNSKFRNSLPLLNAGRDVDYNNLRELNDPKEFQALRKRWQECLEKIEALEIYVDESSVDCASAIFRIGNWCWHSCLEKSQYDDADRLGQHFGGPMYTCEKYPWPADDEGCA